MESLSEFGHWGQIQSPWLRDKVESGIGLRSTLAHTGLPMVRKCVGVDSGVVIRWGYIVNSDTGSHKPCFSMSLCSKPSCHLVSAVPGRDIQPAGWCRNRGNEVGFQTSSSIYLCLNSHPKWPRYFYSETVETIILLMFIDLSRRRKLSERSKMDIDLEQKGLKGGCWSQ